MKALALIPAVVIAGLLISKRVRDVGQDIILPEINIQELITEKAKHWSLEPALVKAFCKVESNFDQEAKNPSDPSYGLMQITPILAQDYGLVRSYRNVTNAEIATLLEPSKNLDVGCWYLSRLMGLYSFDQAVQMYNVGITGYIINGARNSDYLEKIKVYYEQYS